MEAQRLRKAKKKREKEFEQITKKKKKTFGSLKDGTQHLGASHESKKKKR